MLLQNIFVSLHNIHINIYDPYRVVPKRFGRKWNRMRLINLPNNVIQVGDTYYGWEYDRTLNRFTLWREFEIDCEYNAEEVTIENFALNTPEDGEAVPLGFYVRNLSRYLTKANTWTPVVKVKHWFF